MKFKQRLSKPKPKCSGVPIPKFYLLRNNNRAGFRYLGLIKSEPDSSE